MLQSHFPVVKQRAPLSLLDETLISSKSSLLEKRKLGIQICSRQDI